MKILITESQLSELTGDNSFFDVYHGTRSSNIEDVIKGFYKDRQLYGVLDNFNYTEGQNRYGGNIIHYKVPNNGKFIIVDENTAKRYYREEHDLKTQLMNVLGFDFETYNNKEYGFVESKYGMQNAMSIEHRLKSLGILNKVDGFIYGNQKDVVVMQLYKTEIAIPYRYTMNEGETWTKI